MVMGLLGETGNVALQSNGGGALAALGLLLTLVPLVLAVLFIAGMWKTFAKAGQPGWAAIIPIYNIYVLVTKVADRGILWVVLGIVFPLALIVPMIDTAKAFGKGTGYGIGLALFGFVFFPLLGFGDAQYRGSGTGI